MCEFCWWGIVEGAAAGVAAALLVGYLVRLGRRWDRREQVAYFRSRLLGAFSELGQVEDLPPTPDGTPGPSAPQVRFLLLEERLKNLQTVVDHGTNLLTAVQRTSLQEALDGAKKMHEFIAPMNGRPEGMDMYRSLYMSFAALQWLDLPECPPWEQ